MRPHGRVEGTTRGLGLQINQSGERRKEGRKERSRIAFGHSGNEPQELKSAVPPGRNRALQLKFPVSSDRG